MRYAFHTLRNHNINERATKKKEKRNSWFKGKGNKFSTVFFVPPTPGSQLLKLLQQTEEKYKIDEFSRIKFIETSGKKYTDFFTSNDTTNAKCTPKGTCFACDSSKRDVDCKSSNIGYSIVCTLCKERNRPVSYEGESAHNAYICGNEHWKLYKNKNKNSALYKHVLSEHKSEESKTSFEMKIVGKFSSALSRQIEESIRLRDKNPLYLMNSKSEFYGPVIKQKIYDK